MDMLKQLEDAQQDLLRALRLLDEPVADAAVPLGSSSFPAASEAHTASHTVPSASDTHEEASFKVRLLEQLRALREVMADDEERVALILHERDAEIERLRRKVAELEQHHYLPPLSLRYEPHAQPDNAYKGPLLLPKIKTEESSAHVPWGQWSDFSAADRQQAEKDLSNVVVCYMVDGSEKYTPMTVNAIRSLHEASPGVNIGIIAKDFEVARRALEGIPAQFHFMPATVHFEGWNATQFKLDILQFSNLFDTVVWMDSDTLVYRDIRPMLLQFYRSQKPFAFMPDLVMHDAEFRKRWVGDPQKVFVAQASLMMFKSKPAQQLFAKWEERWREWIFPAPFARYNDPMPGFEGSSFCIEQYALAMALEDLLQDVAEDIYTLGREQVFLQLVDDEALDLFAVPFSVAHGIAGVSGMSSYGSGRLLTLSMAAGLNTSARLVMQGSYAGSYSTSSGGLVYGPQGYHMIDNVANCVLHLYNTRYDAVFSLVNARRAEVIDKLAKIHVNMSS